MRHALPEWADPLHSRSWPASKRLAAFSTQNITPQACISHNDESRAISLFTALSYGCNAVEADIWLRGGELLVGHDADALDPAHTLAALYLDPLLAILNGETAQPHVRGRIYEQATEATGPFVLMLDFKSQGRDGADTLDALVVALEPLRQAGFLTVYDEVAGALRPGAVTIVASGDCPFDHLCSASRSPHRDIFFDAPLRWIWEDATDRPPKGREPGKGQGRAGTAELQNAKVFDAGNSYFASMSFKAVYWPPIFGLSSKQRREIAEQVKVAHERGLKARYWGTWDGVLGRHGRERLWRQLVELGVDVLNIDHLEESTGGE